jgi:putative transport protein
MHKNIDSSRGLTMTEFFANNPLFTLFLVSSLGFLLGTVRVAGFSLGVAAVLFVGLLLGAILPQAALPEIVQRFGLVLFVYTIGLSSGAGFFRSLTKRGWRDNLVVLLALGLAALFVAGLRRLMPFEPSVAAGLFAGALTNTPALAAVVERLQGSPNANFPVLGYSVAYPMGVIAMMLVMFALKKFWRVDMQAESARAGYSSVGLSQTQVQIQQVFATQQPILAIAEAQGWDVVFGRHIHNGQETLVTPTTRLELGDSVVITGQSSTLETVAAALGQAQALTLERQAHDYRRMFVSKRSAAGRSLGELRLQEHFGALITRVRRGDHEFLAHPETVLELGDRVRVVAPPEMLSKVADFLGDSMQQISEFNVLSFGLGIALGLGLGSLRVPLPDGGHFELGIAAGCLIMGLILGWRTRSFGILWQIPYSANQTLRQLGLVLFLACIGTRSGAAFARTIFSSLGMQIFVIGIVVTGLTSLLVLWVLHKVFKQPFPLAMGALAGLQTQPAVLGFALEQSRNDLPNHGYSTVYPLAMLAKIMLAQLLLFW